MTIEKMEIVLSDWLIGQQILHVLKHNMNVNVKLLKNRDKPKDQNYYFFGGGGNWSHVRL